MLVAELPALRVVPRQVVAPLPTPVTVTVTVTPRSSAPAAIAPGGRRAPVVMRDRSPGLGFDSPLGRFAITSGGVLLGGAGDPGVSLVVPSGLAALAALIGVLAVLGQRRAERRRRVLR
ncbi:MAG: hypothetical protein ABI317_15155 [Gaiellales bacterium]